MAAAGAQPPVPIQNESGNPESTSMPMQVAQLAPAGVIPLTELERRAIINALEYTKGDRAVAAHLLGIGRTTLYRKLKEYQLEN